MPFLLVRRVLVADRVAREVPARDEALSQVGSVRCTITVIGRPPSRERPAPEAAVPGAGAGSIRVETSGPTGVGGRRSASKGTPMDAQPNIISTAWLIGDGGRSAMLVALLDGRPRPAGEPARAAGVTA